MADIAIGERRRENRRLVLKVGRILIGRTAVVSCMVRNMSSRGGKLSVDSATSLPEQFVLEVFGEPPRRARTIWKTANELGVTLD